MKGKLPDIEIRDKDNSYLIMEFSDYIEDKEAGCLIYTPGKPVFIKKENAMLIINQLKQKFDL